ncbi:MAG: hypothetical protein IKT50_02170 [Clostridia bacterium]|nr:hypothetical protein [Clostridia bacterium]
MKKLDFVRSVSSWGYWICAVGRVFCGIVAAFALLGVVLLISLPKDFVRIEVLSTVNVDMNLKGLLGDQWEEYKTQFSESISPDAVLTEDGISISEEDASVSLEMRAAALYLIPAFAEYSMLAALLHFASRTFREIKDSPVPFTPAAAREIRTAGTLTMALGAVPGLASGLIGLLTSSAMDSVDVDLGLIFVGFALWALSEIFQYGVALQCGPVEEEKTDPHDPNAF